MPKWVCLLVGSKGPLKAHTEISNRLDWYIELPSKVSRIQWAVLVGRF